MVRRDADRNRAIAVSLLAAAGALAVAVVPFAPTILWYTGDTLFDSSSTELSFVSAAWMEVQHEDDHMEGIVVFLLPSLFAALALGLRSQVGWKGLWPKLALASIAIALLELLLISVDADYGSAYDAFAGFMGIQSMIPEDRFTTHALVLLAGSIAWAAGEWLRTRDATSSEPKKPEPERS
ncbi:MAG: hypothetical protein ACK6CU_19335 [Deltaproteobacteria bacterium]